MVCSGLCLGRLDTQSLWATCSSLKLPSQWRRASWNFSCCICDHWPLSCCMMLRWAWHCLLYTFLLGSWRQYQCLPTRCPLPPSLPPPFSLEGWTQLSVSQTYYAPSPRPSVASHGTCSSVSVCFVVGNSTLDSDVALSAEQRWRIPSLELLAMYLLVQLSIHLAASVTRAYCWILFNLLCNSIPRSFPVKLLSI